MNYHIIKTNFGETPKFEYTKIIFFEELKQELKDLVEKKG